jgi:hypothetical protein
VLLLTFVAKDENKSVMNQQNNLYAPSATQAGLRHELKRKANRQAPHPNPLRTSNSNFQGKPGTGAELSINREENSDGSTSTAPCRVQTQSLQRMQQPVGSGQELSRANQIQTGTACCCNLPEMRHYNADAPETENEGEEWK